VDADPNDQAEGLAMWLSDAEWDACVDPSLPPDVVALQDDEGLWWRYPLIEFDI
jgi:hypothetical protein